MKDLIIKFAPFAFAQSVFVKEDDNIIEEKIPQKDIAKFIAAQKDISSIHFFGNEKYAKKIAAEYLANYDFSNVDIYFNK